GTIRYRSLSNGESRGRLLTDGKTFLTHTREEVRWVEMAKGRVIDKWTLPQGQSFCGCSRDGKVIVLRADEGLAVWDAGARKELRKLEVKGSLGSGTAICFSSDGKLMAGTSAANAKPGLVRAWDFSTGKELWQAGTVGFDDRGFRVVEFLSDGQSLVLFDQSTNHITVRDRLSGTQRRKFAIMQREEMQTM